MLSSPLSHPARDWLASVVIALTLQRLKTLAAGPGKLFALSDNGRLYVVSASKAFQDHRLDRTSQSWWSYLFSTDPGVDHVELQATGGLKRGERWSGVSVGSHHLLAVTSKGRTFSLPLSPSANSHRQLGTRSVFDKSEADLPPDSDPRFATHLTELPSLAGLQIAQVATSSYTSFARTPAGRVLGWGANESGQIGLGAKTAIEIVSTPVEVVIGKSYPGGTSVKCLDISAGGSTTFYTVERESPGKSGSFIDLLACGSGLTGALGNGMWTNANGAPTRVKTWVR